MFPHYNFVSGSRNHGRGRHRHVRNDYSYVIKFGAKVLYNLLGRAAGATWAMQYQV